MIGYNTGNTEQNRDRVTKERRFLSEVKLKTFQFKVKSRKDSFLSGVKLGTFIKIQERKVCKISREKIFGVSPGIQSRDLLVQGGKEGKGGLRFTRPRHAP